MFHVKGENKTGDPLRLTFHVKGEDKTGDQSVVFNVKH